MREQSAAMIRRSSGIEGFCCSPDQVHNENMSDRDGMDTRNTRRGSRRWRAGSPVAAVQDAQPAHD
jgi:hypothetical protein